MTLFRPRSAVFFSPHQRPRQRARMNRDAEAFAHRVRDRRRRARRRRGALLLDELQDFVGAFVRALRPPRSRKQAWQPGRGEGRLGGIEGLAADPKRHRDLGDWPAVDPMPPEHLVLHLHPIAAIKELLARKRFVPDRLGARMERAGGAERDDLRVLWSGRTSPRHYVTYNTSPQAVGVNEIPADVLATTSKYVQDSS